MIDKLEHRRFASLLDIENVLRQWAAVDPHVFLSDSEISFGGDLMLDGSTNKNSQDDSDFFTLYYLLDRAGNYYITETNYWV